MTKKELVKNYIKDEIQKLSEGDLIPSESKIMKELSVSRFTVRSAIQDLASDNLIITKNGVGSFVGQTLKKKYVLIIFQKDMLEGRLHNTFFNGKQKLLEFLENKNYIPAYYEDNEEKEILDFINKHKNQLLGLISCHANDDLLKKISGQGIAIVSTIQSTATHFPTVMCDYAVFFRDVRNLIKKYKFKNVIFFTFIYIKLYRCP